MMRQTVSEIFLDHKQKQVVYEIEQKKFVSKYGMEKLQDYAKNPPQGFWDNVGFVKWEDMKGDAGKIDANCLDNLAMEVGVHDKAQLGRVLQYLREGAKIGVNEECRVASKSTNAASALEKGEEVTDALVDWLENKVVIGPYDRNEVPFNMCKISGLMCRMKPNGKARIIVNMSKGKPNSVNEGIRKEDYPTSMSSTRAWLRIMWRCGRNCRFCKLDWCSAYKGASKYYVIIFFGGGSIVDPL